MCEPSHGQIQDFLKGRCHTTPQTMGHGGEGKGCLSIPGISVIASVVNCIISSFSLHSDSLLMEPGIPKILLSQEQSLVRLSSLQGPQ